MTDVTYTLRPGDARKHVFHVTCRIEAPAKHGQRVSLPAWIPGSYLIRDFARQLIMQGGRDDSGADVAVERVDKQTWQFAPCAGPLEVRYEVYARDASVRAAYYDESRAFANGTSVFVRVEGADRQPLAASLLAPEGDFAADWRVYTPLDARQVDAAGWGRYQAPDYETLLDSPILMADFTRVPYEVEGIPHEMLLVGEHRADTDRLARDLARVCSAQARTLGTLPTRHYAFITFIVSRGYGGLEHRDCSVLQVARDSLPAVGAEPEDGYTDFLGLCSHEYFHLWNVKRIRPEAVARSRLDQEAHFEDLWAYEGVTSYYDELGLLRSGVIDAPRYLDRLAQAATRLLRNPGRRRQSLADSSFDAWTKFYKQDENTPNTVVSYYNKGSFVALCLDLRLRALDEGLASLDAVLRALWDRYGRDQTPVPDNGLESLVLDGLGEDSRRSMQAFFDQYVRGTRPLDDELAQWLAHFGVTARRCADDSAAGLLHWAGLRLAPGVSEARVTTVFSDSPAEQAGLAADDVVLAIDGWRVSAQTLPSKLKQTAAAGDFDIHLFRDDALMRLTCRLGEPPDSQWQFRLDDEAGEAAVARREAWLGETSS